MSDVYLKICSRYVKYYLKFLFYVKNNLTIDFFRLQSEVN